MSQGYSSVRLFSQIIVRAAAFLVVALFIFMSAAQKASAAEITVNSLEDPAVFDGNCTLRKELRTPTMTINLWATQIARRARTQSALQLTEQLIFSRHCRT